MKKVILSLLLALPVFGMDAITVCNNLKSSIAINAETLPRIDNDLYLMSLITDIQNDMVMVVTQCQVSPYEKKEYERAIIEANETLAVLKFITK